MFVRINAKHDVHLSIKINKSKNWTTDTTIPLNISLVGYLDGTTWFASIKQQLVEKLNLANEFYDLADVKINQDKYKLLTNTKSQDSTTNMVNNNTEYWCPIVASNKGERILGVIINAINKSTPTIKKVKQIINSFVQTVRNKKCIHDQLRYLINKVIIPRTEYLLQFHIISQPLAETIIRPIKKIFKSAFSLPLSIPDSIIYNPFFSDIINLFQNQLKAQCNQLTALFNTPVLQSICYST